MIGMQIEYKLRPCHVSVKRGKEEKALFHGWNFTSTGGTVSYTTGIVELEDGRIIEVMPTNIKFIDNLFEDYCWDEEGIAEDGALSERMEKD